MKRFVFTPVIAALAMLLIPATAAHAGEPLEPLKGAWVAETFDGEGPPPGMKMVMTFVDDQTLRMEVSFGDETEKQEIKYTATADGKITIYPEPEDNPQGEGATWQVKDDKKLYITTDDGEELVFARPA